MDDRTIIAWTAQNDQPAVSVLFGRRFAITANGACVDAEPFVLQQDLEYYPEARLGPRTGYIRPSLLQRDLDLYPFRERTDLVIQGCARNPRKLRDLQVDLVVRGSAVRFNQTLHVTGDRWIERGPAGLRLSEPEPFEEMPLRYDKAYGGTDEMALAADPDRDEARLIYDTVGEDEDREISEYSYPRNPAGKGYVIDPESASGTPWPNLEFSDESLRLSRIAAPLTEWGARPYPAGFDWFPHAWFPRSAFFGEMPATADRQVPKAELKLGILPADLRKKSLFNRPKLPFAQGAHPRLWQHRLRGDEQIQVSAIGKSGAPIELTLPRLAPQVDLRLPGQRGVRLPAELDLVLITGDDQRVTLLWRATHLLERNTLGSDWKTQTSYTIGWRSQ